MTECWDRCLGVILAAMLTTACGGSAPTTPTPIPVQQTTVSGTLTDTVSGAPIGSYAQTVTKLPAMITVGASGYLSRDVRVSSITPMTVDLIPDAAPFSLAFYRQLARNGYEAQGSLEPLRVLSQAPSIYLQTAGLSASTVSAMEQTARGAVLSMTGGRFSLTAWETGDSTRIPVNGWIVVDLVADDSGNCGRSLIGAAAGHIWLNTIERCRRNGTIIGSPNLFAHELGHALGFWHVEQPNFLMNATATTTDPSALERYHAAIAYHRQPGNRDVDSDALTAGLSAVRLIED